MLAEGGAARGQVSPTVELDEIFRAFDAEHACAFQQWMQGRRSPSRAAAATSQRRDRQPGAVRRARRRDAAEDPQRPAAARSAAVVRDTGEVFDALSERQGQLRGPRSRTPTASSRRPRSATRSCTRRSSRAADVRARVARDGQAAHRSPTTRDPLVTQLRPAARELSPDAAAASGARARPARRSSSDLDPADRRLRARAARRDDVPRRPAARARRARPAAQQLNPILEFFGPTGTSSPPSSPTREATNAPATGGRRAPALPAHDEPGRTPRTSPSIRGASARTARTRTLPAAARFDEAAAGPRRVRDPPLRPNGAVPARTRRRGASTPPTGALVPTALAGASSSSLPRDAAATPPRRRAASGAVPSHSAARPDAVPAAAREPPALDGAAFSPRPTDGPSSEPNWASLSRHREAPAGGGRAEAAPERESASGAADRSER